MVGHSDRQSKTDHWARQPREDRAHPALSAAGKRYRVASLGADTGALTTVATETKPGTSPRAADTDEGQCTQQVCAAVALGWQMAELYHATVELEHSEPPPAEEHGEGAQDLPGVGKLLPEEKQWLRMAQLLHGLRFLASVTGDEEVEALRDEVREAVDKKRMPDDLRRLHVELLSALTVADFRLGKAYSLGRALCEASRESQSDEALEHHLGEKHLAKLIAWCADLKSVLPGHAVADSLRRWQSWGRQKPWTLIEPSDFGRRLGRQGERWRALDMWIVADNLRKGAALNAVPLAELLHERSLLPQFPR
jgi:hypothetical protein